MSEFPRPERLDAIGTEARLVRLAANDAERAALSARFGVIGIDRLDATLTVTREADGIAVRGRVTGEVVQACSITDDPIAVAIDEPVMLLFVDALGDGSGDVELGAEAMDTVEIDGGAIDLGEAAAETLALALDPFPRGPGAEAALKAAGVLSEEDAKPAGPFAALKERLAKR